MIVGFCLWSPFVFSQNIKAYLDQEQYQAAITLAGQSDSLSGEDLFFTGQAYFYLENDDKALEYYGKALENGFQTPDVHFYQGLAYRWKGDFVEAVQCYNRALALKPDAQTVMSEKALVFYHADILDSAYHCAAEAMKMSYELGIPYYLTPHILQMRGDSTGALQGFYDALNKIDPADSYYLRTLLDIGQLEYSFTRDYQKAAKAYTQALTLDPNDYFIYLSLIKAYYAGGNYAAGDRIFQMVRSAYENKALPEEFMKFGNAPIDEFEWNGRVVSVYKNFKSPEQPFDAIYKIYLLSPEKDEIERLLLTEQTLQVPGGPKHLLCEEKRDGVHLTYPYGWDTDDIDYGDLKKAVVQVFEGKMKPAAGSNPGTQPDTCLTVVLGSSTAEGTGPASPDSAWVNRYRAALVQANPRVSVVNLAKGGYTTYHVLPTGSPGAPNAGITVDTARNVTKALSLNPCTIIVNLPSNDAANQFSAAEQLANFSQIAETAQKAGVEVWICTPQPRNFSDPAQIQIQREVVDSIFATYGDHAIDFWNGLADEKGHIRKEYDSGDGIHLNNAGHRLLFERVWNRK